jgi:WD40 repeat protein
MIRTKGVLEIMRIISLFFLVLINVSAFGQDLQLQLVKTFMGHEHGVNRVVFSPNGNLFASGDTRGGIRVWDLSTESVLHAWNEHYGAILDLQFSSDGNRLVSSGADGRLLIWDINSGDLIRVIQSPVDPARALNNVRFGRFGGDGNEVYFGGTNKYVCVKNVNDDTNGKVLHYEKEEIKCGVVSPDASTLTVGVGKVLVSIDLATNRVSNEFNTGDCVINSIRYSNDGEKLLCWCANSRVDVRDPKSLMLKTSFRSGTGKRRFSNLFFSSDQRYVITGDHASRFNIWDLKSRKLILDQNTEQGTVMAFDMKYGPDMLLSASLDKTIKLWKVATIVADHSKKRKKRRKATIEPEELIVI